jgi:hypothetical protein
MRMRSKEYVCVAGGVEDMLVYLYSMGEAKELNISLYGG